MDDYKLLNILSLCLQLGGFAILSRDLWPEYIKFKRKQMIIALINFCDHMAELYETEPKRVSMRVGMYYDALRESFEIIRKLDGRAYSFHSIEDPVAFKKLHEYLIENREVWFEKIAAQKGIRSQFVGEAIALVVVGYLIQIFCLAFYT